MTPLLIVALILAFALAFTTAGFVGGLMFGSRRCTEPIEWRSHVVTVAPSAELAAAEELIAAQAQVIHTLSTFTVEPVNDWTVLPWQSPPTRVEVAVSHRLAELVADLRIELAAVVRERDYFRDLKTRHWAALRKARGRLAELRPKAEELPLLYEDFLRECGLREAYHEKARSFANRILTTQELLDSGAMRSEITAALGGTIIQFPEREKAKAA